MKKVLITVSVLLFSISGIFAQKGISFGLRAIPTLNWVSMTDGDSLYSYDSDGAKLGIGFGPSLRYKFSDNFNVDISGIFTWQKFGIKQTNAPTYAVDINRTEDFKIQFLQIPVNLNGQFDVAQDFQAIINFGVGTGFKLSSLRLITDANHPDDPDYSTFEYEDISAPSFIDFYLTAGGGAVYNIEDNLHLSLTVQYNNGILDGWLNGKNATPSTINDLTLKHKNIAFSLAFYIDL